MAPTQFWTQNELALRRLVSSHTPVCTDYAEIFGRHRIDVEADPIVENEEGHY